MGRHRDSLRARLRVAPGVVNLAGYDPGATPGAPGRKKKTTAALADDAGELADLQERLFAEGAAGGRRRILLVLQGMDTSGKGGTIDHVVGVFGPAGCRVTSFKKPTAEELAHHFLWRIRRAVPPAGVVGVFDRSHYEDVLIVKVHGWIDDAECTRRYAEINAFEKSLTDEGVTVVKCFLNISFGEQRSRLLARLDEPAKHWKFNEGDIDERQLWPQYQAAYAAALEHTSTDAAPWYVVPSDHKWYRNWAVGQLLRETLEDLDPQFPQVELDVERLKGRLAPPH